MKGTTGHRAAPSGREMLSLELFIVVVLIVINGLLSMSELAIVSSRPARLEILVQKRVHGARRALVLASDHGKFLSTVQIGITQHRFVPLPSSARSPRRERARRRRVRATTKRW